MDPFDAVIRQTFQKAYDLDIFVDKNLLAPLQLKLQAMALPDIGGQTNERVFNSYAGSDGKFYFAGSATIAAATHFVLYSTPALGASPTWTSETNAADPDPKPFLEEYKDGMFFGITTTLRRWGNLSGSPSITTIGSVTTGITFLRNHRGLGMLFFVHDQGRIIGRYDNTTFTASKLVLDRDDVCVGIEEMGRWCILGIRGVGSKKDRFMLWDGAATTVDDIYNLNSTGLQGFRMVGGAINYVSLTNNGVNETLEVAEMFPGKSPNIIRSENVTLAAGLNTINPNAFATFEDTFFYGLNGENYSDYDLGIFAYGTPSEKLAKYWALWRLVSTGEKSNVSISSIKHNGSSFVVIWGTSSLGLGTQHIDILTGTGITPGASANGEYESDIFPLNEQNPGEEGKLTRLILNHLPLPAGCGFTVQIRHFGNYPLDGSVVAQETYQDLLTPQGSGGSVGKTQSTENAAYTEISGNEEFKTARYAQIKIKPDEVNALLRPTLVFPVVGKTN